jgi:hypothetical protein
MNVQIKKTFTNYGQFLVPNTGEYHTVVPAAKDVPIDPGQFFSFMACRRWFTQVCDAGKNKSQLR